MISALRVQAAFRIFACPFLLGLALAGRGWGQARHNQSAEDLVKFFTHPKPFGLGATGGNACAPTDDKYFEAEAALIGAGESAVAPLEAALDSLKETGTDSPYFVGAAWLMNAYARIKGRTACPRLWGILSNREAVRLLWIDVDRAAAVGLGLTSYVSRLGGETSHTYICGFPEPRDVLDSLILTCMRESLGSGVAVGYRFEIEGTWSKPREPGIPASSTPNIPSNFMRPEIDTVFTDGGGNDCGKHRIRFLALRELPPRHYLVDDADLSGLVELISACATEPGRHAEIRAVPRHPAN